MVDAVLQAANGLSMNTAVNQDHVSREATPCSIYLPNDECSQPWSHRAQTVIGMRLSASLSYVHV